MSAGGPARRRATRLVAALVVAGVAIAAFVWYGTRPAVIDPPVLRETEGIERLVLQELQRLTAAVRSAPRDAAAWTRLGMGYQANVFNDLAIACYTQSVTLDEDDARAWYHLARARAETGDLDAALADIQHAIDLESSAAHLFWQSGGWLLDLGRTDEAAARFAEADRLAPDHPAAVVGLARVALQRGDAATAATRLESVGPRVGDNATYVNTLLATAYRQLGRTADADRLPVGEAARRARWSDPWIDEVNTHRVLKAWLVHDARAAIAAGRPAEAVGLLTRLRAAGDRDPEVMLTLGRAQYVLGRLDDAIDQLEGAIAVAPGSFPAHLNLAVAYGQAGRLDAAVEAIGTAVALAPQDATARLHQGRLLLAASQPEAATTALQRAIELGVLDPMAEVWLAESIGLAGRWRDAADRLSAVVTRRPDLAAAHVRLAWARAELGWLSEAQASLETARRLDPRDPDLAATERRIATLSRGGASR